MFDAHLTERGGEDCRTGEAQVRELEEEIKQLRSALASNAPVDQAVGVILAVARTTVADAWDDLREMSMRTGVKVGSLAEQLVEWGHTGLLSDDIRTELERRLSVRHNERRARRQPP
ncbi:ANTAR domain-containing protein [Streptomyces aureocirculatus]|uniref:ANTAR domain-containing protein n=1 Tax=Streptomyces aureocirculatus TaxID=67275 RepID=UPI00068FAD67|nr:ANTAR domain-containing protein [Streptomyces aureocirculatus]